MGKLSERSPEKLESRLAPFQLPGHGFGGLILVHCQHPRSAVQPVQQTTRMSPATKRTVDVKSTGVCYQSINRLLQQHRLMHVSHLQRQGHQFVG